MKPTADQFEELEKDFDSACIRAAFAIYEADYLIFHTGAGWSADSGLPVYKDVANIAPYRDRRLDYRDLCQPGWLADEPELFFGFWGMCFNDYRNTTPHEGYKIVQNWKNQRFGADEKFHQKFLEFGGIESSEKTAAALLKESTMANPAHADPATSPGRFYHLTSNVDAHALKSGFEFHEVYEIHGNLETWQCGNPSNCSVSKRLWSAPTDYRFTIDPDTLLVPKPESHQSPNGFGTTFPNCKYCTGLARPAVLMFSDHLWRSDNAPFRYYNNWVQTVKHFLKTDNSKKIVVLEVGCGNRVPTVRSCSESWCGTSAYSGQVTFIRINPEFPFVDTEVAEDVKVISILSKGLRAIKQIDQHLTKIQSPEGLEFRSEFQQLEIKKKEERKSSDSLEGDDETKGQQGTPDSKS